MSDYKELKEKLFLKRDNGLLSATDEENERIFEYCEGYKSFLNTAKTEREAVKAAVALAEEKGFKVIIAGAGMAAHLPGMCAAIFPMPVIGIPMHTTSLGGRDSLYSIVQMPSGIPVATVAINGGANAGLLAAKILATSDPELLDRLKAYSRELKESVQKKDAHLSEVGYQNYK